MPGGVDDEGLVEHERGGGEAGLEVAVAPLLHGLADGQRAVGGSGEVGRRPLEALDRRPRRRLTGRGRRGDAPHVAFGPRVRTAGTQAFQRIGGERQRLDVEIDELDGLGREVLADGRQRQNRLALVERLVRQGPFDAAQVGQIVGRDDAAHAGQGQGAVEAQPAHAPVRHRD